MLIKIQQAKEGKQVTVGFGQIQLTAPSVPELYDRFVEEADVMMPPKEDVGMKLMNAYVR